MSSIIEALSSPTAVLTFGATTLVLLGTTYYFISIKDGSSNGSEKSNGSGRRRSSMASNGSASSREAKELDRTKYPEGYLTIYYGSQTGTAQMFAKQIASESESHGFCPRIVDLQDVVDNDDDEAIDMARSELMLVGDGTNGEPATNGDGGDTNGEGEPDEDAALLRASLSDPLYRDADTKRSKAIFFMATYGEGEPTDNAQQFVEMMKGKSGISNIYKISSMTPGGDGTEGGNGGSSNNPERMASEVSSFSLDDESLASKEDTANGVSARHPTFLKDVDYAVFGLGNKQYEHYNNMSRFTDVALEKCGATRVAPIGLGDDDDDLEGDFENWKDGVLWPSLVEKYVKGKEVSSSGPKKSEEKGGMELLPVCPYKAEYIKSSDSVQPSDPTLIQTSSKHYSQSWDCPVVAKRELRDPSDGGSTIHMEIDISKHPEMKYVTADNLGILPCNKAEIVESVGKALGYDLDQLFHLVPKNDTAEQQNGKKSGKGGSSSSSKHSLPFPTPCTVREALTRYCDLTGPPRRSDLKQLAPYATNDMDRKALLRMSSKEGKAEYKEKIVEAHVGIADIVTKLCTSITCPLEHFVMVCPRLQPRYYTISSSSTVHPTTIHITLAVLEEEKKSGGVFTGVCSGFLAGLKNGDMVRAFVRESTFRLPKQVERPVIMFGPGTGIAPMRAILQELSHGRSNGVEHGNAILYFGCKNRTMDYIYKDELEAFEKEGTLAQLHLAFSREQAQKVYVQHLLAQRGEETWKLIHEQKASIFVCGAVKMGADVDHTLQDIISKEGGMSREKAKGYLDKMAGAGRFVQELWS